MHYMPVQLEYCQYFSEGLQLYCTYSRSLHLHVYAEVQQLSQAVIVWSL